MIQDLLVHIRPHPPIIHKDEAPLSLPIAPNPAGRIIALLQRCLHNQAIRQAQPRAVDNPIVDAHRLLLHTRWRRMWRSNSGTMLASRTGLTRSHDRSTSVKRYSASHIATRSGCHLVSSLAAP
jgi:hypothetical protein